MTRIITAPADRVTGLEFFDAITGSSPEQRAARKAKGAEFKRKLDEKHAREMDAIRERMLAMVSPERAEIMKAQWAAEHQLTETLSDPFLKDWGEAA